MIEIIALIILICSLGGIVFILCRKIPALVELPKNGSYGLPKGKFILKIENKVRGVYSIFEKQIILHKFLSWVRCLMLKMEVKIDHLLHKIRKNAQRTDKK